MTQDEAERLAREVQHRLGTSIAPATADILLLCKYILSGDHKREIENAAFERAAQIADEASKIGMMDSRIEIASRCGMIGSKIRALIQPPAQKENGE